MPGALVRGAVREQDRRQHLEGNGEHLRGHAVAPLLGGDDVVLPRRRAVPAAFLGPGSTGQLGIEERALPRTRDVERVLLARR